MTFVRDRQYASVMYRLWLLSFLIICTSGSVLRQDEFNLNLVHFNDFHARFEETSPTSTKCIPADHDCIGGFSRLYTAIKDLKTRFPDSVVLNAGDSFQGTLWYNLLRWNVTQYFMNKLPLDAHTLGNHEFDHKIEGVVPYLKNLKAPMLVSNIDDSLEPTIQGLYNKSRIIQRGDRKIGIVGVILKTTNELAQTEQLKFTDEVEAVKKEAALLVKEGANIIIVLSHAGLDVDRIIAENAGSDIDIIVGGHTHSLLYTGTTPSGERPVDVYPVVVTQSTGTKVLIVQASAYTKYLGFINVTFDNAGKITGWEGQPIYLNGSIEQDPEMLKELQPYKLQVDELGKRRIGRNQVVLSKSSCASGECNLGDFVNDAFIDYLANGDCKDQWACASASIINQGGLRTDIAKGDVTYEDLIIAQPFNNILHTFEIKGKYILEALEFSVNVNYTSGAFYSNKMLQVSGIRVIFDLKKPPGQRVMTATIRCAKCNIPVYSAIESETVYTLAAPSFISDGGDGFTMLSENKQNEKKWDSDIDILENYVAKQRIITQVTDRRIVILT